MSTKDVFNEGNNLSLPVPTNTKSGSPVRVGGLNAIAQTDEGAGGNPAGSASCQLKGVHLVSVTGAVANVGDPVYIDPANNGVNVTNTNPVFGHALETKTAAAAEIRVRLTN